MRIKFQAWNQSDSFPEALQGNNKASNFLENHNYLTPKISHSYLKCSNQFLKVLLDRIDPHVPCYVKKTEVSLQKQKLLPTWALFKWEAAEENHLHWAPSHTKSSSGSSSEKVFKEKAQGQCGVQGAQWKGLTWIWLRKQFICECLQADIHADCGYVYQPGNLPVHLRWSVLFRSF